MLIGIVLVIFGGLFLLQNLGYITFNIWSIFWPLVLIALGVKIAMKKGDGHWCCGHHWGKKETAHFGGEPRPDGSGREEKPQQ